MGLIEKRFDEIAARYTSLRLAVVGDFCLDRYLEIDPARRETSIETGLPVHNVVRVRAQPGGAGTIVNNLVALGVREIHLLGFCGDDGEGFELRRSLAALRGVKSERFITTGSRRTFTYCKPLVMPSPDSPHQPPTELNRLDSKNWTPTPGDVERQLIDGLDAIVGTIDGVIVLDQVDEPETGVVTRGLLSAIDRWATRRPELRIIGDSRRGLSEWPAVTLKMNRAELAALCAWREGAIGSEPASNIHAMLDTAARLARQHSRDVIVTLSEQGLLGATPAGDRAHIPALPVRGPIDIVGAGDAVTANLCAAFAAGASLQEALRIAAIASSIVIHQLGTTGTATVEMIREFVVQAEA